MTKERGKGKGKKEENEKKDARIETVVQQPAVTYSVVVLAFFRFFTI